MCSAVCVVSGLQAVYMCSAVCVVSGLQAVYMCSAISVVTGLQAARSTVHIFMGVEIFLFLKTSRMALRFSQHPIQLVQGFLHGSKVVGARSYSPPSSGRVKNEWSYFSTLLTCLHGTYRDTL